MWAGLTRIAESLDRIIIQGKAHSNSFSLSLSLSLLSLLSFVPLHIRFQVTQF
jgi:hypothetical protein